jgi:predicted choloylglycine hydrolase
MVRLVRNYDLSPDLNEGLLLRTEWTGMPVMGMVEFLWGLSDGINAAGLSVALAFGGRKEVAPGFGVTTILRYVLETTATVDQALEVLSRVPSHMAYNIILADRHGETATAELLPGGSVRVLRPAIATNHQHGPEEIASPSFTKTLERLGHLKRLLADGISPDALGDVFLDAPLLQRNYAAGFGTLFTAVYDPMRCGLTLRWPGQDWNQSLDSFAEGRRTIDYEPTPARAELNGHAPDVDPGAWLTAIRPFLSPDAAHSLEVLVNEAEQGTIDWTAVGMAFVPGGLLGYLPQDYPLSPRN